MKGHEFAKSSPVQLGVIVGSALVHTAWKDHRAKTHRSIELSPPLDLAVDIAGGAFTDTTRWAATHRIHHSTPDVNLVPSIEYADLIEWLDQNPEVAARYEIPDEVVGIDPAMEVMTHEEVMEVGQLGKDLVKGMYQTKPTYSAEEIEEILYGQAPRYLYESPKGGMDDIPEIDGYDASLQDIRYILRDPHSPALHPNGMRGIAVYNMPLYQSVVKFFENNPQYMPEDLAFTPREKFIEKHKKAIRLGFIAVNIAWRLAAERPTNVREAAVSAAKGAVVAGIGTLALIAGGNIVNSLGHGGKEKFNSKQFTKDLMDGTVRVKDNGTYTTDNALLSPPTLGEVGGQYEHHEDPSLIAYTHETGIKKVATDPFGAATEFMATHGIGMKTGPGFNGPRPDMPSEAALRLEDIRRNYLAKG